MTGSGGYDTFGLGYRATRRPDPRIAAQIDAALSGMRSVANVGAGTGSYEPITTRIAVDPSRVMTAQRAATAAPAVLGVAEALPIPDAAVDAALAVLTVHHWPDLDRGLVELRRIARRRVVIMTWDADVFETFWLVRDYVRAAARTDRSYAVPLDRITTVLGGRVETVPVPHDCTDGFGAAYWRRPDAYLDPEVRAGMSMFARTEPGSTAEGLDRLRDDIGSGQWRRRYADLLDLDDYDAGYRLVVADL